jgi:hypothetical protein
MAPDSARQLYLNGRTMYWLERAYDQHDDGLQT